MITVLPVLYFAPINYYVQVLQRPEVVLEVEESFTKQTYRNRCHVLSANGLLKLTVPISHKGSKHIKDIEISYVDPWCKQHLKALKSAYESSAFFDYYEEEITQLLEKKPRYLLDLNLKIHQWILDQLQVEKKIQVSQEYQREMNGLDLRSHFNAKELQGQESPKYFQVFFDKVNFIPNLSVLDLIFNLGPESSIYITDLNLND